MAVARQDSYLTQKLELDLWTSETKGVLRSFMKEVLGQRQLLHMPLHILVIEIKTRHMKIQ
jgi:hypothetical protein